MVDEEKKEDIQEKKIIEKYTPVKVLIIFVVIAIVAFLVINNLRSYEKQVGNILHPKPLKGPDATLFERAIDNKDSEYCKNIQDATLKERCLLDSTPGALDKLQQSAIADTQALAKIKVPHPESPKAGADGEECMLLPIEQQGDCFRQMQP